MTILRTGARQGLDGVINEPGKASFPEQSCAHGGIAGGRADSLPAVEMVAVTSSELSLLGRHQHFGIDPNQRVHFSN